MGKIKKFNEFKKNEAVLPEIEVEKPEVDVNNPIDIEGVSLGDEGSQLDIELEMEAKYQENIAKKKGLKQKGTPDNHIS